MVGRVRGFALYEGLTVEVELDPSRQPFLFDHRIDGTPVLPGVMGIEAFVEVAQAFGAEWLTTAVEDVEFLAPFKFYRDEPRRVVVQAVFTGDGEDLVAHCRLIGRREFASGERVEETVHFTGRVRLARQTPEGGEGAEVPERGPATLDPGVVYDLYFHGPAYRVLDEAWTLEEGAVVGRLASGLPAHHVPAETVTLSGPRLAELCFQTAGLIEFRDSDRVGLPRRVARIEYLAPGAEDRGSMAVVERLESGAFDARVIDREGNVQLVMRGYETIASPLTLDGSAALSRLRDVLRATDPGDD
jgi:hypothetical protein